LGRHRESAEKTKPQGLKSTVVGEELAKKRGRGRSSDEKSEVSLEARLFQSVKKDGDGGI